jgi:hypothetical protein
MTTPIKKYNIIDNLNFYEELLKDDPDENNNNNENSCLLTGLPLVKNFIELSCNHKFNYDALYKEVSKQKMYNELDTQHLMLNQIRCPYCRTITNKLLPYIPLINSQKVTGVNSPDKFTMTHKICSYVFMCGKNKGIACNSKGFETNFDCNLCEKHWKMKTAKAAKAPKVAKAPKDPKVAKVVKVAKAPKVAKVATAPKVATVKKAVKVATAQNNTPL